jgi:polyhydroxyalkanoate synthase
MGWAQRNPSALFQRGKSADGFRYAQPILHDWKLPSLRKVVMIGENVVPLKPEMQPQSSARAPATVKSVARKLPSAAAESAERVFPAAELADRVDRTLHASVGRFTAGLSPASLAMAYFDWATHLAAAPGKRIGLADKAVRKAMRLADYMRRCAIEGSKAERCIEPLPQDRRFAGEAWRQWPFNAISQAFLLNQQWWHAATTGIRGVSRHHEDVVEFAARQMLDMFSPANFPWMNPEVIQRTLQSGGMNFAHGWGNLLDDWQRAARGAKPAGAENFVVGDNVAVTRGRVVYRNRLIELIRYAPATAKVRPEPVLIVPAWIMKYYILDLSPHNSLVKYLTEQGYTVFMVSWKNPTAEDCNLGFEDYRALGVMAAIDAVMAETEAPQVHAVGYCLGGTLLSIAAAAMARDGDHRLKSATLLAAQVDFTEAGELLLFIDESQIAFLDDMMWEEGYLDAAQMAGTFQLLRSNDLVWSRMVHNYLMGEREGSSDLMAWNADATRMPYRMHGEYLRHLYLENELAEGRLVAGGAPVALSDIHTPIFAVGTARDHVAPWRSTHKIHLLTDTEVTYVLTTGGHNAGIVSEIGHKGRSYQVLTRPADGHFLDPDAWQAAAPRKDGSWWPEWKAWLDARSGAPIDAERFDDPAREQASLGPAPGTYVLEP